MNLGLLLKDWRYAEKLGLREAASVVGIPAATFNRIEHGEQMDGKTLAKVLIWIMAEKV